MEDHNETTAVTEYADAPPVQPSQHQLMRRDFSGTSLAVGNSMTAALEAKERATIEARWIMAMRRPRNMDDVRQALIKECKRPGFADAAVYEVPRGEKKITGLSIRFAEVAARCMGNMGMEVVTIHDDDQTRLVRVTVTDFETNLPWSKDISIRKTVERKFLKKGQTPLGERINSYGDRVFIVEATDDDVNTKEAAQVSKALRTLILRCVPGHLQDEAFKLCNAVYADKAAKDPDSERVNVLDAFAQIGVLPSELAQLLGHTTERMSPAELAQLRKWYTAINSGEASIADLLAQAAPAPAASAPAAPQATNATPAQQPAASAPAQPQRTPGARRGAAALKSQLADKAPTDKAPTGAGAPAAAFDKAAAEARQRDELRKTEAHLEQPKPPPVELPPDEPPPRPGYEDRACARCAAVMEVPIADPPGGICYACSQA